MFSSLASKPNCLVKSLSDSKSCKTKSSDMEISQSVDEKLSNKLSLPYHNPLLKFQPPRPSIVTTPAQSPDLTLCYDSPLEEEHVLSTPSASPQIERFPDSRFCSEETILFSIGEYQVISRLGTGAFSEVYLAKISFSSKYVALKLISRTLYSKESFEREVNIMRQLNHPNIVQFIDSLITEQHYVIVQEYVPNGELLNLVTNHQKDFSKHDIISLFSQCVDAIMYLHQKGFAHRDIKLENFLVDKRHNYQQIPIIKLCDFGFTMSSENISTIEVEKVGSDEYLAPELIVSSERAYDIRSCDVWSLGIILYTLLVGCLPFSYDSPQNRMRMFHRIASGDLKFPAPHSQFDPVLQQTVRGLLKTNPRQRSSLTEVLTNLTN